MPVIKAAEAIQAGTKMDELVPMVKDWCSRSHSYMVFDTLEYLRKGGRIGRAQALLGGLLKITPILTLREGIVTPVQRTRSRTQAIDALVNLVKSAKSIKGLMLSMLLHPMTWKYWPTALPSITPGKNLQERSQFGHRSAYRPSLAVRKFHRR